MKNYRQASPVDGSTALSLDRLVHIIEFPEQDHVLPGTCSVFKEYSLCELSLFSKILAIDFIVTLRNGSIQGKTFNQAKPWQSWLAGLCFFAFAIACIFFAN